MKGVSFVNKTYTKEVPFLNKMVYKRVRVRPGGGTSAHKILLNTPWFHLSYHDQLGVGEYFEPVSSSANTLHRFCRIENVAGGKVHEKGELVAIVTLDLSKAFDFLLHLLLIKKLEAYGLDNRSCSFLPVFLQNRLQRVKVGDAVSSWELTSRGVPPGSVLGPLLFNVFSMTWPTL